jgi:hypothetical protein
LSKNSNEEVKNIYIPLPDAIPSFIMVDDMSGLLAKNEKVSNTIDPERRRGGTE